MWHFVLLWLTCDALIIQRYVKIMTCTDLSVSFRLLVYTRCLFSRLLWLGGGVYNFFWRRKLMNCTNILALCVCCSVWGVGDEVVQLGEGGSRFSSVWVLGAFSQGWQIWPKTCGKVLWQLSPRLDTYLRVSQMVQDARAPATDSSPRFSVAWKKGCLSNLRNSKH